MAWLDDRAWCHPKLVNLNDRAFRVYINGISYSSGMSTRGILTPSQQRFIGATASIYRALVSEGLWDELDGTVRIHDWDEHNARREARRDADRQRKRHQRSGQSSGRPADKPAEHPADSHRSVLVRTGAGAPLMTVDSKPSVEIPNGISTAQALVGEYVDQVRALGSDPPSRAKGIVARQVGELLSEGQPADAIRGAISLLVERRLHPSTLPTLLLEATAGPARKRSSKGVSAHDILDMAGRQLGP